MAQSMWDVADEMAKRHDQAGGSWLRLQNDGDKAVVVFLGEPYPREVCFVDGKFEPFTDERKQQGHRAVLRITFNVALLETRELKILEQGVTFYKDLVKIRAKYGLDGWAFEIQRHGAAKDPRTQYTILPERQLAPEERQAFSKLPVKDLPSLYTAEKAEPERPNSSSPSETVDPKTLEWIVASLKALPREAADRFCAHFHIPRVRLLPASDVPQAKELIPKLAAHYAPKQVEVDPFAD
jgi:hypothetical protein